MWCDQCLCMNPFMPLICLCYVCLCCFVCSAQRVWSKFRGQACDDKIVETAAAELKKNLVTFNSLLEGKQYVTGVNVSGHIHNHAISMSCACNISSKTMVSPAYIFQLVTCFVWCDLCLLVVYSGWFISFAVFRVVISNTGMVAGGSPTQRVGMVETHLLSPLLGQCVGSCQWIFQSDGTTETINACVMRCSCSCWHDDEIEPELSKL